jgi:hypothetical protein
MNGCCRAAVVEELREQGKLLRERARADMKHKFSICMWWAARYLEVEADALEAYDSAVVDSAE